MLDTNIASYLLKGKSPALRERVLSLRPGELACISVVTEAELLYGIAKSGIGEQRTRMLQWFLQLVSIHSWGRQEAAVYGRLLARSAGGDGQESRAAGHADCGSCHRVGCGAGEQ